MKNYAILLAGCFLLLKSSCQFGSYSATEDLQAKSSSQMELSKINSDPCATFDPLHDPNNEELKKKYLLEVQGYPEEISVKEAITEFNQRANCHHIGKLQPALTEIELLTAIRDIPNEEIRPSVIEKGYLRQVSEKRFLPKGSLIYFKWGIGEANGHKIIYWKIYLRFDLHTYPIVPDDLIDPKSARHSFTIRRQYISSQKSY